MTLLPSTDAPFQDAAGRYELKFVAPAQSVDWAVSQLKFHPYRFRRAYPDRLVHNIYFDTEELEAYADNLSGISRRTKARYRWYDNYADGDTGTFEVKLRRNQVGWKLQYPVAKLELIHGARWQHTIATLKQSLPDEGAMWLVSFSRVVLINCYRRQYFISRDGHFRVTVDDKIRTSNQFISSRINLKRDPEPMSGSVIVEIKFEQSQRHRASEILDHIALRRSRHSKYMTGAEACLAF